MSNLFTSMLKNIFGRSSGDEEEVDLVSDLEIPGQDNLPDDERFVEKFTEYGGRFLYCESPQQALNELQNIFAYEHSQEVLCFDPELTAWLDQLEISHHQAVRQESPLVFIKCEYLVAFDGSIMVSSAQTGQRKPHKLPKKYVILAEPDQIAPNISKALQKLKKKHGEEMPTNISCIRKDIHAINHLSNPDEIYLLLVEQINYV